MCSTRTPAKSLRHGGTDRSNRPLSLTRCTATPLRWCAALRAAALFLIKRADCGQYPSAADLHSRGSATFGRLAQRRGWRGKDNGRRRPEPSASCRRCLSTAGRITELRRVIRVIATAWIRSSVLGSLGPLLRRVLARDRLSRIAIARSVNPARGACICNVRDQTRAGTTAPLASCETASSKRDQFRFHLITGMLPGRPNGRERTPLERSQSGGGHVKAGPAQRGWKLLRRRQHDTHITATNLTCRVVWA
jgi:hypothetical protein